MRYKRCGRIAGRVQPRHITPANRSQSFSPQIVRSGRAISLFQRLFRTVRLYGSIRLCRGSERLCKRSVWLRSGHTVSARAFADVCIGIRSAVFGVALPPKMFHYVAHHPFAPLALLPRFLAVLAAPCADLELQPTASPFACCTRPTCTHRTVERNAPATPNGSNLIE